MMQHSGAWSSGHMSPKNVPKRCIDLLLSLLIGVLLCPLLVLIAVCVLFDLGRPVLFRQTRAGVGGNPFVLYKFRTMWDRHQTEGELASTSERLTVFGRFLRSTSLDELPELWNVIRGDMSLVGPRPLLMDYLSLYTPKQSRRHEALPGLTGWAQIHGRNAQSWEERFEMDVWYVENRSFLLDLKILAITLGKVLSREGVLQPSAPAIDRFKGSKQ